MSLAPVLASMRNLKHRIFLARNSDAARRVSNAARSTADNVRATIRPYRYDPLRYLDQNGFPAFDHFLHRDARPGQIFPAPNVPRVVWCLWTGDNSLTPNRLRSLELMKRAYAEFELRLVTGSDIDEIVVPGHPLHSSFKDLSFVHRSDYLRAYLMHHHGGAYVDIKPPGPGSLSTAFDLLNTDDSVWLTGAVDPDHRLVGNLHGKIGDDTRRNRSKLVGIQLLAARPGTAFTAEWLTEVERRLDYYATDLKHFPAVDPYGQAGGYPVTWIGIGADVYQPLQLKYLDHVKVDRSLRVQTHNYR